MSLHLILIAWFIVSVAFALLFSPWLEKRIHPRGRA